MTYKEKNISWLEYEAARTGKSIEEVKQHMSEIGKKSKGHGPGFAALTPEERRELGRRSAQKRWAKVKESKMEEGKM